MKIKKSNVDFYIFNYLLELMIDYDILRKLDYLKKNWQLDKLKNVNFHQIEKNPSFDEILPPKKHWSHLSHFSTQST